MNSSAQSNAVRNEKVFRVVSYTLVFLMLVCVIMAASGLIHNVLPKWHSGVMAGVMLLIVLERLYAYPRFKSLAAFSPEWAVTLGVQWVVFVIFIRLLLSYVKGSAAFLADMQLFIHGDMKAFFSAEFIVTLVLAILAWNVPARFLELLDEIGADQRIALREGSIPVQRDEPPPQQQLVSAIFNLGIILVLVTALASIDLKGALSNAPGAYLMDPGRFSAGEASVLLYFIFGLALLTQGRLMSLQIRWNIQRISISSGDLAKRWSLYSLLFLFLLILAVSLLPTGDSLGIFSILGTLFGFLLSVFLFLGHLILTLVILLFSVPFLLLGFDSPLANQMPVMPELPTQPVEPPMGTGTNEIWILLRSILLWGALIAVIVFSLMRFIRQHEELLVAVRKAPMMRWLILAWEWLRRNMTRTRDGLKRAIAGGWQNIATRLERRRSLSSAGWINFRALDPRRRIYFFYLTMIHHGDKQGLGRKLSQTPSEYAATLESGVPTASEDIDSITNAFMEARYSHHEVNLQMADMVRATWQRIRRALQRKFTVERVDKK
ncbi:MAG TPA: DUF4129 domain-containing protein [Anaerolineales bacterium]|nr:DUF4129 domain-containing protein [Anaerolineales bacterium]